MMLAERRLEEWKIAEAIGIGILYDSLVSILNDHVCTRELSTRWVSQTKTSENLDEASGIGVANEFTKIYQKHLVALATIF